MTNEEAIKHIQDIICESNSTKPNMTVFELEKEALYMAIEALQEHKMGKWKSDGFGRLICSECGYKMGAGVRNYCPHCGSKNRG